MTFSNLSGMWLKKGGFSGVMSEKLVDDVCCICLMEPQLKFALPCQHEYCFLCIKGWVQKNDSADCPMCRASWDTRMLDRFEDELELEEEPYQWVYSGKTGGWWEYDPRTSEVLEEAYQNGEREVSVTIAAFQYLINFERMEQHSPYFGTFRNIRRLEGDDMIDTKGVGGVFVSK